MKRIITREEVAVNMQEHIINTNRIGDTMSNPDGDLGEVHEHTTINEVGTIENDAVYNAPTHRYTVVHQWALGTVHSIKARKRTRPMLAVGKAIVNGKDHGSLYIRQ